MTEAGTGPSMSQEIFKLGLSVETVSLYLAAGGLTDAEKGLSLETFRSVWSGNAESLENALGQLLERNILVASADGYEMVDVSRWR